MVLPKITAIIKKYKKSQNFKNIKTKINYMKSKKKNILTTAKTTTIIKN